LSCGEVYLSFFLKPPLHTFVSLGSLFIWGKTTPLHSFDSLGSLFICEKEIPLCSFTSLWRLLIYKINNKENITNKGKIWMVEQFVTTSSSSTFSMFFLNIQKSFHLQSMMPSLLIGTCLPTHEKVQNFEWTKNPRKWVGLFKHMHACAGYNFLQMRTQYFPLNVFCNTKEHMFHTIISKRLSSIS